MKLLPGVWYLILFLFWKTSACIDIHTSAHIYLTDEFRLVDLDILGQPLAISLPNHAVVSFQTRNFQFRLYINWNWNQQTLFSRNDKIQAVDVKASFCECHAVTLRLKKSNCSDFSALVNMKNTCAILPLGKESIYSKFVPTQEIVNVRP